MKNERLYDAVIRRAKTETGSTECWIWEGSSVNGNPVVHDPHTKRLVMVRRVGFAAKNGYLLNKKRLQSQCKVPLCWNPSHLYFLGDRATLKTVAFTTNGSMVTQSEATGRWEVTRLEGGETVFIGSFSSRADAMRA